MANQTMSFRLSDEYQAIFNKLHEQACEANGSPISKVTFLEKVLDFYSSPKVKEVEVLRDTPETTAELEQLRKDYAEVSELSQSLTEEVASLQRKLSENNDTITRLQSDYECLQRDYTSKQQEVNTLEKDLSTAENRSVLDFMKPFPARLLALTAERLSQKYKREVTPIQVLGDMFLRYTIEKWSEWFYPWVLSEADILNEAQKINPYITSVKQLKTW